MGFITGPNGLGRTELGTLGGNQIYARGINDSGQVWGYASIANGESHIFITGPNGVGMTDLNVLNDNQTNSALDMNNSGQIVGSLNSGNLYITGPNGVGITDLVNINGYNQITAVGINDSGQVVANFSSDEYSNHTFITGPNGVGVTDIGTLGGNFSSASDINDSGEVVGGFGNFRDTHAFITGSNGNDMKDLGTFGGRYSSASAINDLGEVVGIATTADGTSHSFLYSHGGMTDLRLLPAVISAGWDGIGVSDINNNGQIVGRGNHNGHSELFLLSYTPDTVFTPNPIFIPPIPEPTTWAMLLAGLVLIGYLRKHKGVQNQETNEKVVRIGDPPVPQRSVWV